MLARHYSSFQRLAARLEHESRKTFTQRWENPSYQTSLPEHFRFGGVAVDFSRRGRYRRAAQVSLSRRARPLQCNPLKLGQTGRAGALWRARAKAAQATERHGVEGYEHPRWQPVTGRGIRSALRLPNPLCRPDK